MIANGVLCKGLGVRASLELAPILGARPRSSAPRTPARHVRLDNFVRLKIAPRVINAAARKSNDTGSVVIDAQQLDRRSVVRKAIDYELRNPIAERGQILGPIA